MFQQHFWIQNFSCIIALHCKYIFIYIYICVELMGISNCIVQRPITVGSAVHVHLIYDYSCCIINVITVRVEDSLKCCSHCTIVVQKQDFPTIIFQSLGFM